MPKTTKINPFLWFNNNAEQAVKFYISVFKRSKILRISRYGETGGNAIGRPAGSVMTIEFELDGQRFVALNGGPAFKFNESISFFVNCQTQAELDYFWEKLSIGGKKRECGWLNDQFGVCWQIVPSIINELLDSCDPEKSARVMEAVLKMRKLDIKTLKNAARNVRKKHLKRL